MKSWKKINAGLRFMTGKHKAMQDKQKQRYMYIVKPESDIIRIIMTSGWPFKRGLMVPDGLSFSKVKPLILVWKV